mmetsp:Transcript_7814/g.21911  ORF Transcript_7814/g.21911 Transcript_7814/m.21911 type:complete len:254 (+) Transcript_7814:4303-5064(+)
MTERPVVVVRAQVVAAAGAADAAVVALAAVDFRRVHREAIEALVHDPLAPERRVARARRRPGTVEATLAVVIVVGLADVANRRAGGARAPRAELPAAAACGGTRGKSPRRALFAFAPTRLGLNPPGRAVDAGRRACGRAVRARVAPVARSLPRDRSDPAGLATLALQLTGRGLMPSGRTRRTTRCAVRRAERAGVAGVAINLVRRVGAGQAGEAVNSQGTVRSFAARDANNIGVHHELATLTYEAPPSVVRKT